MERPGHFRFPATAIHSPAVENAKMKNPSSRSRPLLLAGALAALLVLPSAAFAQDGPEDVLVVSNRAMDTLEAWSSPQTSLEDLVLGSHPEVFEAYLPALVDHYRGQGLSEVFADQLPRTHALFLEAFAAELAAGSSGAAGLPDAAAPGDADLVAFAMALENSEYQAWQASLDAARLDLHRFVKDQRPDLLDELARASITPADRGVGLLEFVDSLGDPTLSGEFQVFAAPTLPRRPCTCRMVIAFTEIPSPWTHEIAENFYSQWGNAPKKMRTVIYDVWARGAARAIDFYRVTEHNLWQVDRAKSTNSSSVRVRMVCSRGAGAAPCEADCEGELVLRVGYASRVYEKHDVGGAWSKQAEAFTGDLAQLFYSGPANLPSPLFEKGVAVAGQYQTSWNPSAIGTLLFNAAQVTVAIVSDNASSLVDAQLVNSTIDGIAGLITHNGSTGDLSRDMMAAWDNSVNQQAVVLLPNQTHLFELFGSSRIYSRGYGKWSWTWGNLDSADYFVGVVRGFSCADGSTPPRDQGFWLQAGSSDAPWSASTLQNQIGSFLHVELGTPVPASELASSQGVYP